MESKGRTIFQSKSMAETGSHLSISYAADFYFVLKIVYSYKDNDDASKQISILENMFMRDGKQCFCCWIKMTTNLMRVIEKGIYYSN